MKLSDYVVDYLVSRGVKDVFLVTGGAVSHLVDSFYKRKDIRYICMQHEQAAAMAADAYSRLGKSIGVVMATSGPGATNLVTAAGCSWFDSIPCLYLTGQVNTYEHKGTSRVRQAGFQETDIVSILKPLTKFAQMVTEPKTIRYYLEKAVYIAKSGRPGPVLLDLPMDIQRSEIDPHGLKIFNRNEIALDNHDDIKNKISQCIGLIQKARRPVILIGGGVRSAKAVEELKKFIKLTGFPVVVSLCGLDSFRHNNQLYAGFFGVYGQRSANFAVANSDLLIGIGARFDSRQTGTKPRTFARGAKKIIVDIDPTELNRRVHADIGVASDAKRFLIDVNRKLKNVDKNDIRPWLNKIKEWKDKYYYPLPVKSKKGYVNPYSFLRTLSEELHKKAVISLDTGANLIWAAQALAVKEGQRVFASGGMSPMGYALPAAIGASAALSKKPVICIIGDGGMQFNIQELQTIFNYKFPVKIFIMNNYSYGMIKQFQDIYFNSRYEATDRRSGYSCPDFIKVGKAYGLKTFLINKENKLRQQIAAALRHRGPALCNVSVDENVRIIPKLEINKPIEDQAPYLDRKEFLSNMIIEPY